jgi:hypothetical protein
MNKAYFIITITICCFSIFNPQHDRELLTPILLSGFFVFQKIWVPKSCAFWAVVFYGILITFSYLTTIGSSINYRPLFFQYIGIGSFVVAYYLKPDLKKALFLSGVITGSYFIINYLFVGKGYFNSVFMHKNVAGMFFAMVLVLGYTYKNKILTYSGYLIIVTALALTYSRGAIAAVVIALLVYVFVEKKYKYLWCLSLVGILFIPGVPAGKYFVKIKDFDNGRFNITWPKMWEKVKEKPLLGCGIGNMHANAVPNNAGPHNLYLFLLSAGFLSLALWLFPFIIAMKGRNLNLKLAAGVYVLYALFSECAANTPPNQFVYWSIIGVLCCETTDVL